MHPSTCKTRSSTSYQLPETSHQPMLGGMGYVFAAQPVGTRYHMISLRGLSLATHSWHIRHPAMGKNVSSPSWQAAS